MALGRDKTEIIGHVGKDAEMRYTPTGTPVTSFDVCVTKTWTDESGQKHEKSKWFRVSCWRKLGEIAAQYVSKGMKVFVAGEVEAKAYVDREGQARPSLELTASELLFLSNKNDAGAGAEGHGATVGGVAMSAAGYTPNEADLPF